MEISFTKHFDGFAWKYKSESGDELSIVCHQYSYGGTSGQFETMCSWINDVQGYLNFGQVQQKIETIYKRENEFRAKQ